MRRSLILLALLLPLAAQGAVKRSPVEVVSYFGKCMSQYLDGEDDIQYRSALDAITVGRMKCLVDDNITDWISKQRGLPDGTMHIDDYLTQLRQWSFDEDIAYSMERPVVEKDFDIPTLGRDTKAAEPMQVVSARVHVSGDRTYDMTEIFFVRGDAITKIHSITMGEKSIGYALWLYNQKKYDEAFQIFRSIAHRNPRNYEAIYYTTVMEIRRQGCSSLAASVRDMEAACNLFKAVVINRLSENKKLPITDDSLEELVRLAYYSGVNYKSIPYLGTQFASVLYSRFQIASEDRMQVMKKGLAGFVDDKGHLVIPYKYDSSFGFNGEGYAAVSLPEDGNWGYIDRYGKEVVPVKWDSVSYDTKDGKAFVSDDKNNVYLIQISTGEVLKKMEGSYTVANSLPLGDFVALLIKDPYISTDQDPRLDIVDFEGNVIMREVELKLGENYQSIIVSNGKHLWSTDRHFL